MTERNDRDIVNEVLNGNAELFCLLIHRYEKAIFNYIYRMVKQKQEAEDLAQETFVRVFSKLRKYNNTYEFTTWIYRIALNVCRDSFRKKRLVFFSLQNPVGEEEESELEDFIEQASFQDPDGDVLNQELRLEIERAIERLPLKFREIIVLRHIENLSYEEIAAVTGLPIGTVKTYIYRARKRLQDDLQRYLD
ncbi:MAG TPA: sigma-70 family RNA polymerase sigma factor [Atribacteraceae bacterium]|nr:sigma-70 family RNA polymerase sigma factor [Atribacteraceae bacterium]